MFRRWAGPLVTVLILGGVLLILFLNLETGHSSVSRPSAPPRGPDTVEEATAPPAPGGGPTAPGPGPGPEPAAKPAAFREYPIGDPVIRNHMKILAVWLPPVRMEGMADTGTSDVIHLEADVHATDGNPNGFALDEFIPYLKVRYEIVPAGGGPPIAGGELVPMVARDGLHYGASVAMPKPGEYRLVYDFQPPSAGGLGRHSDAATGVAPWWPPFRATFDWDYAGPPRADRPTPAGGG